MGIGVEVVGKPEAPVVELGINAVAQGVAVAPPRFGGPYKRVTPLDDGIHEIERYTDGTCRLMVSTLFVVWEPLRG